MADGAARKSKGRLSREDQRKLGDLLKKVYDEVIHEGVPDRFTSLLNQLEPATDMPPEQAEATDARAFRPPEPTDERDLSAGGSRK